jgi:hypothetical protein
MAVANTLPYYGTATIMTIIFLVLALKFLCREKEEREREREIKRE